MLSVLFGGQTQENYARNDESSYAKKYASTIYQSLVLSTPLPFSLNDRLPLPCLIKMATKQLRHFGRKPN